MSNFTVQDILNARPYIGVELLPLDTELVREETGYSVKMTGFYSLPELASIASDLANLNTVFDEKPETIEFNVTNSKGNIVATRLSFEEAGKRARAFESETGDAYEVSPAR